ncbi:YqcC family protein [Alteromonas halophila]|uniref:YqcC family protein n=1 Tax=Alteromonas halophila TaxID=516698 RepID=UPI001E34FA00|nr:YqcC family protein [Alteromonas halophila]
MSQQVQQLLAQLEAELKKQGEWATISPHPSQLASQAPFAVDTLTFCEWLQFIFLPKLSALVEQGQPLPPMAIAPAAEVYLPQQLEQGAEEVIAVLVKLDAMANNA